MDAQTITLIGAIGGALISASAILISQGIGNARAASDHKHELTRDHAQRVFDYKRSVLERNRIACTKLQADMYEYRQINRTVREFERRFEESAAEAQRVHEANARYSASEDDAEPFLFEQEEQALQATEAHALQELEAVKHRLAEFNAALQESLHVIQLDYGALDIIEPVRAYMTAVGDNRDDEALDKLRLACIATIVKYLDERQMDLLRDPAG